MPLSRRHILILQRGRRCCNVSISLFASHPVCLPPCLSLPTRFPSAPRLKRKTSRAKQRRNSHKSYVTFVLPSSRTNQPTNSYRNYVTFSWQPSSLNIPLNWSCEMNMRLTPVGCLQLRQVGFCHLSIFFCQTVNNCRLWQKWVRCYGDAQVNFAPSQIILWPMT